MQNCILVKDVPNKFIIPQNFDVIVEGSNNDKLLQATFKQFYDLVFMCDYKDKKYNYMSSFVKYISIDYVNKIVDIVV